MVEETNASEDAYHAILVAGGNHIIVAYRTAGFGDVLDTLLASTLDVVAEWEEGIGA